MTETVTEKCWSDQLKFGCKKDFEVNPRSRSVLCPSCKTAYRKRREELRTKAANMIFGLPSCPPKDGYVDRARLSLMEPHGEGDIFLIGSLSAGPYIKVALSLRDYIDESADDRVLKLAIWTQKRNTSVLISDMWREEVDGAVFLSGRAARDKEEVRYEIRKQNELWILYVVNGKMRA